MSTKDPAVRLERFLALLYTDAATRAAFLVDPRAAALAAGLSADDADAMVRIDRIGLELAADSFARKRARRGHP